MKMIVMGDGAVGKTSLMVRYIEDKFDESSQMTLGVQFFTKDVILENAEANLQFWDLGGQERFQMLHSSYVAGASGALYVFDLSNIIRSTENIDYWISLLKDEGAIPMVLIGAKADLIADVDSILRRNYEMFKDQIDEIRQEYNFIDYIETSSKDDMNVEQAFITLVKAAIGKESERKP